MNNKFKGLYDTEKTTFITDKTEPINYYEPIIKTPKIQNHTYSINFDKTKLYKEIEKLQQEIERKDNIINELKVELKEARKELQPGELIIGQGLIDNILDKIKELEEK